MSVVTPIVAYATSLDAADQAAFAPMASNPSLIQWFEKAFSNAIGASSAQAGEQLIPGLFNPLPQGVTQAQATAIVDAATGCVASTQAIFSILNENILSYLVTIGVLNQSPYTLQYVTPTPSCTKTTVKIFTSPQPLPKGRSVGSAS